MFEMNLTQTIIFIIVLIILLYVIYTFNKFISLRNKLKQSKSSIDIYLNQRFDLIPNLVEVVKAYSEYEQETFMKITELRENYKKTKSLTDGEKVEEELKNIFAVAENNPNLKANEQYMKLFQTLEKMESQLQAARRIYNGDVTLYNTAIEVFPGLIIAKIFGMKKEKLFEVNDNKKENIKVNV